MNCEMSLQHLPHFASVLMAPGHIPAFLFATLIVSFCYGELDIYSDGNILNILHQELPLHSFSELLALYCASEDLLEKLIYRSCYRQF